METTTNYGLKIYEGSDLFNPLTVENVNAETLDSVVKAISNKAVGNATELKTGTVHALSRLGDNADRDVFKFTATSAFTAGDTFTLDGEQVSALTVAGEQLSTGCYIIGSTVLVAKRDTLLTFFVAETTAKDSAKLGGELPAYYATASDLNTIDGYVTGLQDKVGTATLTTSAPDLSGAVNELDSAVDTTTRLAVADEFDLGAIAFSSGYNIIDITALNSRITLQNYKRIEFHFHDSNQVGGAIMGSAFSFASYWRLYAYTNGVQYWNVTAYCYKY